VSSLPRVLVFARAVRGRLALAVLTGALALGAAVGLMATSAWLISRAAEHPPIVTLMVAIAAVRALSIGRGVLRYAERLVGHGAALGVLRELRVAVWKRLEAIAPAGLPEYRSGDLLARLVATSMPWRTCCCGW
jgi:ATP-binding cassette, subfamily C, bacterial CydCD